MDGLVSGIKGADFLRSSCVDLLEDDGTIVLCAGFLLGGGGLGGRGGRGFTVGGSGSIYVYSCVKMLPSDTECSSFFTAYGWTTAGIVYKHIKITYVRISAYKTQCN